MSPKPWKYILMLHVVPHKLISSQQLTFEKHTLPNSSLYLSMWSPISTEKLALRAYFYLVIIYAFD